MSLTTDSNDPELGHGSDTGKVPQNKKYLVLSDEKLYKEGADPKTMETLFIRPIRQSYIHVGNKMPICGKVHRIFDEPTNDGYVATVCMRNKHEDECQGWQYIDQKKLDSVKEGKYFNGGSGCGGETTMGIKIAETYARDPKFYGSTYCVHCQMHKPVDEFVWSNTTEKVGS